MALYAGQTAPKMIYSGAEVVKGICLGKKQVYSNYEAASGAMLSSSYNRYLFTNTGFNKIKVTVNCTVLGSIPSDGVRVSGTAYVSEDLVGIPSASNSLVLKSLGSFKADKSSREGELTATIDFPYSKNEVPAFHVYTNITKTSGTLMGGDVSDVTVEYTVKYEAYFEAVQGEEPEGNENTAVLGVAVLGKMILGKGQ